MSKNTKKKNAIRFGAIAIAILIVGGAFSVWALSTQATATAGIGEIHVDGIDPSAGDDSGTELLQDSVAGRPGSLNTPYELYTIGEDGDGALNAEYTAVIYLTNGDELIDAGIRYMTLDMELNDDDDTTDPIDTGTLTLENGMAGFIFDAETEDMGTGLTVDIVGGSYSTHPFADFTEVDNVQFVIDIEPGQPNLNG